MFDTLLLFMFQCYRNVGKLPDEFCEIVSPLLTRFHFTQLESSRQR